MTVLVVFKRCVEAIQATKLVSKVSKSDKEFHFQNWFQARLTETRLTFETAGRNRYPDFRMVKSQDGYELKGLAYPGRHVDFDSNSQVPTGFHNDRTIYYVFGRYPKKPDGKSYPVLDLVICHGDFLNADHGYVHKNKNIKGFGSYGDITIRDRKMYIVPTPFQLVENTAHHQTLILPADVEPGPEFVSVGDLRRREADTLILSYSFDLKSNELAAKTVPNPGAGREHAFRAWRLPGSAATPVKLRTGPTPKVGAVVEDERDDAET